MPTLAARISELLRETGLSQVELAKIAGVGKQAVGQWVNGPTKEIKALPALLIQEKLSYSARWLADGTPPKKLHRKKELEEGSSVEQGGRKLRVYYLTEEEDELLQAFRRILPEHQEIALTQVKALVPKQHRQDAEVVSIQHRRQSKKS